MWGQLPLNALLNKEDLGWATITHPFHPFTNQKFKVLKLRKFAGEDSVILKGSYRGTFAVPVDWTDQGVPFSADHAGVGPSFLSIHYLIELTDLVKLLRKRSLDT